MNTGDASSYRNSDFSLRPSIQVSAGLVFRNGFLLITQRRAQDHLGGLWEFPGGKRESNESDEECLRRELREELGIEVEIRELIESIRHDYSEKSVHLKFFYCRWLRNEPQPIGCAALKWITASQLAEFSFPAADAQLLETLRVRTELWSS